MLYYICIIGRFESQCSALEVPIIIINIINQDERKERKAEGRKDGEKAEQEKIEVRSKAMK